MTHSTTDLATRLLPAAEAYLRRRPEVIEPPFTIVPLAQGEYNLNYLVTSTASASLGRRVVLRVNTGSQEIAAGVPQIVYEARALRLLQPSGIAPALFHVDASPGELPYGLLVEEYLPGRPLDYGSDADLRAAGVALARLHTFRPAADPRLESLVAIDSPLSRYLEFGRQMFASYRKKAPAAPADVVRLLDAVERSLTRLAPLEAQMFPPARRAIVHTDVQAHNFIVPGDAGSPADAGGTEGPGAAGAAPDVRLVDWEKPVLDDPSYDLCHFLAPTSTLWKCGVQFDARQRQVFLDAYRAAAAERLPEAVDDLDRRVALRQPFVHWRAITWCAMAWVEYQRPDRPLKNADTFARIEEYLRPGFLEALFAPVLTRPASSD
ncbi:MAG: aminoglycoside phosphotransferase family protein [Chloroflexi bacterium]|nr:aminoglycoside phosphotransferase family protein [Chloroflexota bacterium]